MENQVLTHQARQYKTSVVIYTDTSRDSTYQLVTGEKLIFGLKKEKGSTAYIVRKELTSENYNEDTGGYDLTLSTSEMKIPAGMYFYDIALKRISGELERIIGTTGFEIRHSIVLG